MQKCFLLFFHFALCKWEPEVISVEDVDIPEANAELNLMDGDIRREFENSHGRSTINDKPGIETGISEIYFCLCISECPLNPRR